MHHPVRIVEDMCVLDHLTDGRLEFGVGRGAVPIERYWFSQDWWESRDRFTDVLGIIEHALSAGEISSERSRFYDFPTMPLSTKPLQERIPFWYPGSPLTAGRHGMSLMWPGKISPEAYEQYLESRPDRRAGRRVARRRDGRLHLLHFPTGDMTFRESRRTLELLIGEVIPQLEPSPARS